MDAATSKLSKYVWWRRLRSLLRMTRSCRSSSPQNSTRCPSRTSEKASQDIPKTSCTRKGSFKQERKDVKSKQFFLWRLKALVPGVSTEDKLSELEIVERTIAYIQYLQTQVHSGEDDGVLLELLQSLTVSAWSKEKTRSFPWWPKEANSFRRK